MKKNRTIGLRFQSSGRADRGEFLHIGNDRIQQLKADNDAVLHNRRVACERELGIVKKLMNSLQIKTRFNS
jgi:hypothetical protein